MLDHLDLLIDISITTTGHKTVAIFKLMIHIYLYRSVGTEKKVGRRVKEMRSGWRAAVSQDRVMRVIGQQWTNDRLKSQLNDEDNGGGNNLISRGQIVGRHTYH